MKGGQIHMSEVESNKSRYCTCAIITSSLYFFYPIFTGVYIVEQLVLDNLRTKQWYSSIFESKIRGL